MIKRASDIGGEDRLTDALNHFRCYKDLDIENFLRHDAINYLNRGWCSVYLILNEEAFDKGLLEIEAYFTLSHKNLIPEDVSKEKIRTVSGFKDRSSVHFVLIGHLGKHIESNDHGPDICAQISSAEILDFAFEIAAASSELIPCRCVLVECSENPKVQKVYTDYEFKFFQFDGEHYQFYKRI